MPWLRLLIIWKNPLEVQSYSNGQRGVKRSLLLPFLVSCFCLFFNDIEVYKTRLFNKGSYWKAILFASQQSLITEAKAWRLERKNFKMRPLFGNASSDASSSKNLVEFKAGKMHLRGTTVTADKRKGLLYLHQSDDSLMHFCWKDRTTGIVEDVRMIFICKYLCTYNA